MATRNTRLVVVAPQRGLSGGLPGNLNRRVLLTIRELGPAAVISATLIDLIVLRIQKDRWVFPDGAILTGLIVGMILSPHEPWYVAAVTAAVGVGSKYVVRARKAITQDNVNAPRPAAGTPGSE